MQESQFKNQGHESRQRQGRAERTLLDHYNDDYNDPANAKEELGAKKQEPMEASSEAAEAFRSSQES